MSQAAFKDPFPLRLYCKKKGNSFAISFASDMSTFFGYFQRSNESPIAYSGLFAFI